LNVEGRERIFALIKQRYPDADPREKVLDWVFELAQTRVLGQEKQNALGLEPFDDVDLAIFEHLLDAKTSTQTAEAVRNEYPAQRLASLDERISKISEAAIFAPLLR
jgi:hypothetical protein